MLCFVPVLHRCVVCLLLCKEEGSSPVSAITERRDVGLYEVPLSVSLLGFDIIIIIIFILSPISNVYKDTSSVDL